MALACLLLIFVEKWWREEFMQMMATKMAQGNAGNINTVLLQMMQSMSGGQATSIDLSVMQKTSGGTDVNSFSQVLLEQMLLFLQSSGVELSSTSISPEEFISSLKKLFEDDPSGMDSLWTGFFQMASIGQQALRDVQTVPAVTEGSDTKGESARMEKTLAEEGHAAAPLTSVIVQTIKESLKELGSKDDRLSMIKDQMLNPGHTDAETFEKGMTEVETDSRYKALGFKTEIESFQKNQNVHIDSVSTNIIDEETPSKVSSPSASTPSFVNQKSASPSPEIFDHVETKQIEATLKDIEPNIQAVSGAIERVSAERRATKAADIKPVVQEQSSMLSLSGKGKAAGEDPSTLHSIAAGGWDAAEKPSSDTEIIQQERNVESMKRDIKNTVLEKEGNQNRPQTVAFQAVTEKVRPDLKTRMINVERNVDNGALNSVVGAPGGEIESRTDEASSTSIINRVAAEFREHAMSEGGRVKITLTPPSLGSLEMDVSVMNSKVRVMLVAENKDVQRMLSGNIETLKSTLQTQGLTIERCDVMMQDRSEDYPQGFNARQDFGQHQTSGERPFRSQDLENESLRKPQLSDVQAAVRLPQYAGSEVISLFA